MVSSLWINYILINIGDFFLIFAVFYLLCLISVLDWQNLNTAQKKYVAHLTYYKTAIDSLTQSIIIYSVLLFSFTFNYFSKIQTFSTQFSTFDYLISDFLTLTAKIAILGTTVFVLKASEKQYFMKHPKDLLEYPIIVLLMTFFLLTLVSANDLLLAFCCIVGFSLCVYVLLLNDSINHASREAAVKYYYLSAFSSGLIAFSVLICYLVFHTTNFTNISWTIQIWQLNNTLYIHKDILNILIFFITFGFLFKLAAFPSHLWAPSVYEGSPNPVMAFFILPIKIGVLIAFWKVLGILFCELHFIWSNVILFSSVFSMLWGSFGALVEKKFKKFLAYSSINQMGFLLIGFLCFSHTEHWYTNSTNISGIAATFIYLFVYIVTNFGVFAIFLGTKSRNLQQNLIYITDFKYFSKTNNYVSNTLILSLFSMAGIPPLAGFFGKYFLLFSAFHAGYYFVVIVALFSSLVSTFYYLRLIVISWFLIKW